ncbi:SDR family NAD(P)-dependent oxidoreductase [Streptomyces sp. NPDC058471]|uniref:SDR family NAD(P)-dependent oxidoreductase n=1 Tax=Streptomyces sp. NPDC058471 TaxID=3346516 RepID=UPI00364B57B9
MTTEGRHMGVNTTDAAGAAGAADLSEFLRREVAELLGTGPQAVAPTVALRDLGIDSLGVTRLAAALSGRLGRPVPAWVLWQHPTVAELAAFLAGEGVATAAAGSVRRGTDADEPIAVVGLGCRLPGGISTPEALWQALLAGTDAVGDVPQDRWDAAEWVDEDPKAPGRTTTRKGGFLDDVAGFDAAFFRISPAEAARMDPQQRIALEVAWSALEDARVVPGELAGSRTGVFLGTMWQEYHLATGADAEAIGSHSAVGWDTSIVPARIAYALGLRGPALSVGTACSSSLAAVHLAANSLRLGESDLALAGGVSLMLHPHTTVAMTKFGGMNPDGQCRAFDAGAAGYVRGEGCGVVVLRRLSDALRDGDRIYAVLRGSAANNDGASNGLTAPNPAAQADVLRDAWRAAGVAPHQVAYVEAHGTGTPLGDPIEAAALGEVFAPGRTEPLLLGSAKTNFGHLEPAAGALGLLKTALSLYHGELPASLHFERPSPGIDFAGGRLEVVAGRRGWPVGPRHAGVSGFGFGGTNVHLALSEAPHRQRRLVALAARSEAELADGVEEFLRERGAARWPVTTAGAGAYRVFAAADGAGELADALRAGLPSAAAPGAARPDDAVPEAPEARPAVAFCFSGHGSQWLGMGRDLLAEPVFRAALDEADAAVGAVTGWSVLDELVSGRGPLERTEVIQPVLFSLQVALARTLEAWGVVPDVVFGQSVGEVAAAVVSGALSLDQGAHVIGVWSRLVAERAVGLGTVLVCELDPEEAAARTAGRVTVAGVLSPGQVCLSGAAAAVEEVERELSEAGVRTHRVAIDYPSHSVELEPLQAELVSRLGELRPAEATVPFLSSVTGAPVPGTALDAQYWASNMARPMLLHDAVTQLDTDRALRVVEVSPHPVLTRSLERSLAGAGARDARVLATCRRDRPARQSLEELVGALWRDGVPVHWAALGDTSHDPAGPWPWPLSARTGAGVRAQAAALHAHLVARPELSPADVGHSLATTRTVFEHRAAVVADGRDTLLAGLAALASGAEAAGVVTASGPAEQGATEAGPVLVFPGQGSQWAGMARELRDTSPVFAAAYAACARALEPFVDWDPAEAVDDAEALERVDVVQPVLWAVMVSLAELWRAHGVRPAVVVGHSQGEIAAACVSGGLSLEDGARVVALRSQAIARSLAGLGGMVSVALPRQEAELLAARWDGRVSVAVVNGPGLTVVSGAPDALDELMETCARRGVRAKRIAVDYASHSAQVDTIRDELLEALAPIRPRTGDTVFFSTVTGAPLDTALLDAEYWFRNLRSTVEFRTAVEELAARGHRLFVEASPHPVLTPGIEETVGDRGVSALGSLRRDNGGPARFLTSLAEAFARGARVDWTPAFPGARTADLPPYAFQHRRYWLDPVGGTRDARPGSADDAEFWTAVRRGDLDALTSALDVDGTTPLAELLPALAGWHRRQRGASEVRDWRYEITWKTPKGGADPVGSAPMGPWLALVPSEEHPFAAAALSGLTAAGLDLVPVVCGYGEDRAPLAEKLTRAAAGRAVGGVLSLLAPDGAAPDGAAPAAGAEAPAGYLGTLRAVQALGDAGIGAPLWCVTRAAVRAGSADRSVDPAQRMVWGLGRVAALEHSDRWGGLVDLPADEDAQQWRRLAALLGAPGGEDQLAVRADGVRVRRLVRSGAAPATAWRPHGTVLVTGGTGALGVRLARWLAARGAQRLVLTSRRGADAPGAQELGAELRALGTEVVFESCDVADREQLRGVLERIPAAVPLTAVLHTAAVLDDAVVAALDADQVERVLRAKVRGAVNLHELTQDQNLSAFVLFSSYGATVGIPGQGNYAPANAFLDALAERRRLAGLPATAVSWGAWGGGGMARTTVKGVLERHGVPEMDPELALLALQQAIDSGRPCQTVADVRWQRFLTAFTAARPAPLLADLPDVRDITAAAGPSETPEASAPDLRRRLTALPAGQRERALLDVVCAHTSAVLGFGPDEPLDPARAFKEIGFDSVTGVELRNRLGRETGLRLPATLVFEFPTPTALAAELLAELALGADGSTGSDGSDGTGLTALEGAADALGAAGLSGAEAERLTLVVRRLEDLLARADGPPETGPEDGQDTLGDVSDDELFQFIDQRLGLSHGE